jgi:hypothetical protein
MKNLAFLLGVAIALTPMISTAVELESTRLEMQVQAIRNGGGSATVNASSSADQEEFDDLGFGFEEDASIYEYDYKSPKRAFIYSLLIPGLGQRYAKSHTIKPLLFLAVEAGVWMGYFKYHNDGNKKTDEFEAFADEHWIEGDSAAALAGDTTSYVGWLWTEHDVLDDEDTLVADDFTHHLPDWRDQQYYEMIGKYDQFRAGWDDYWLDPAKYEERINDTLGFRYISPNRERYETMRKDANDLLDRANKFIIVSMLNHLISAFDAALAANRYNKNKAADMWLTVNAELKKYSATDEIPVVRFSCRF